MTKSAGGKLGGSQVKKYKNGEMNMSFKSSFFLFLSGLSHYNYVFSKGACLSSSIGFVQSALMNDLNNYYINPDTRIFLSWGSKETRGIKNRQMIDNYTYTYRRNKAVANKIAYCGASSMLYYLPYGEHNEASWQKLIPIFMDYLWK